MNDTDCKNESKHLEKLLIEEYKEAKNDLRLHNQLIWMVISIFFATNGVLYLGYSQALGSTHVYLAIGAGILGYSFSIVIIVLMLGERRRWSIEVERRNQIKKTLIFYPQSNTENNSKAWVEKAKKLLMKSLDDFFNEIDENGKEAIGALRGFRIERKSVYFILLIYQFLLVTLWSGLIWNATIIYLKYQLPYEYYILSSLISIIILVLISLILIKIMIRKKESVKLVKKTDDTTK
jgi:hypothetical protein